MGLHRFKIALLRLLGENQAGNKEWGGVQRELTKLLGEMSVK